MIVPYENWPRGPYGKQTGFPTKRLKSALNRILETGLLIKDLDVGPH